MPPVKNSSFIKAIDYDPNTTEMVVTFKDDRRYHATGVDTRRAEGFIDAVSHGNVWNHFMRNNYAWSQLPQEEKT